MKLEHVALNVSDPHAIADWYVQNLGMSYAKQSTASPFVTFISDDSGKMMIELYNDPAAGSIPNYAEMNTLLLHVAFVSDDPRADQARLVAAGACTGAGTGVGASPGSPGAPARLGRAGDEAVVVPVAARTPTGHHGRTCPQPCA